MKSPIHEAYMNPIEKIVLVDEIVRPKPVGFSSKSPQGHLLHIVESGEVKQQAGGSNQLFRKGDVVWYHEVEPVKGVILKAPWRFITIGFIAPALAPPDEGHRILHGGRRTQALARQLLALWQDPAKSSVERALRCVVTLSELLLEIMPSEAELISDIYPINAHQRWWHVEKHLRTHLDQRMELADIAALAGMSVCTTSRACKSATGMTPVHRLRSLRLAYAQNLLQHSSMPITEIAFAISYSRVQEFSRDFRKTYGCSPSEMRARPPEYRQLH